MKNLAAPVLLLLLAGASTAAPPSPARPRYMNLELNETPVYYVEQ